MGEVVRSGRETVAEPVAGTRGGGTVRPFLSPVTCGRRQRQVASPVRERARQRERRGSVRARVRERVRVGCSFSGAQARESPPFCSNFLFLFFLFQTNIIQLIPVPVLVNG